MEKTVRKNFQMAFLSCIYEIHILAVRKLGDCGVVTEGLWALELLLLQ